MQSALSGCNWPCQNCFSQTVSFSRFSQTTARSPVQEMQLARAGWRDETGERIKDKYKEGKIRRREMERRVWIIGILCRFIHKVIQAILRSVLCAVNQNSCVSKSHTHTYKEHNTCTQPERHDGRWITHGCRNVGPSRFPTGETLFVMIGDTTDWHFPPYRPNIQSTEIVWWHCWLSRRSVLDVCIFTV